MKILQERTFCGLFLGLFWISIWAIFAAPKQSEYDKINEDLFWLEKVHSTDLYDCIVVGDSRTYRGISPKELNKYLPNLRIFNFGFSSGRIDNVLLEAAYNKLDPNGAKIVILPITIITLLEEENEHFLSYLEKPKGTIFLYKKWKEFYIRFMPIPARRKIRKLLPLLERNYQERYYVQTGWVGSWTIKNDYEYALSAYIQNFKKRSGTKKDLQAFKNNLQRFKQQGVKIVAFRMPTCAEMKKIEDSMGGIDFKKVKEIVKESLAHWIEIEEEKLKLHSYDSSHLDMDSAILFSKYLGCKLKNILTLID